jgi:hypothetical protein
MKIVLISTDAAQTTCITGNLSDK